jgi:hypothetical protein
VICTIDTLTAGTKDTTSCYWTGSAVAGQYHNTATVTGSPPVGSIVSASDESFYFGAKPNVEIEFKVNGEIADSSPGLYVLAGSQLTLDYVVTNTGNVPLTTLVVKEGATTVCNIPSLDVNGNQTCTRNINALVGQQSSSATVTADPPSGLAKITSEPDPMYYFGATLNLGLVKKTNGQEKQQEPVYVMAGLPVNWTYQLENTGNVRLDNITVVDDHGTPENPGDDHTVCLGITLEPGGTYLCEWSQTAQPGLYENTATVTASHPAMLATIHTHDSSSYFGATLDVSLVKQTNDQDAEIAPGPLIGVGQPVNWTYVVANSSNVSVGLSIADSPAPESGISCDKYTLVAKVGDVIDSATCTGSGTALAGQYENTATVTVTPPTGLEPFNIQDSSHYFGVITGIDIEKHTQGQDADDPTGPLVKINTPVEWDYILTNLGNMPLTNVTVWDDNGTPDYTEDDYIVCDSITLQPYLEAGYTHTCSDSSELAVAGQYVNVATVTGDPPDGFEQVSDSDPSHYFGSEAGVTITKLTNGVDIDSDPTPYILFDGEVVWTYIVENIGNLSISNIVVTDNDESLVIVCDTTVLNLDGQLEPGASMTCTAEGFAIEGLYENIGQV